MSNWQNRITGYALVPAEDLLANPLNPRRHPARQREALRGSLDTLGFIAPVVVNQTTQHVLDGHARIEEALSKDEALELPVIYVDLSEDEEKLALASFDFITTMATYERDALDTLLHEVNTDDSRLQEMLSDLALDNDLYFGDEPVIPDEPPPDLSDRADELQKKWQVQRGDLWLISSNDENRIHKLLCEDTFSDDVLRRLMVDEEYTLFCDPYFDILIDNLYQSYNFKHSLFITGGRQLFQILKLLENFHEGVLLGCASIPQMGNPKKLFYEHKVIIWSSPSIEFGIPYSSLIRSDEGAQRLYGDVYHHTSKPIDAVVRMLKPFKQKMVLDLFAGSGSGLIACERLRRIGYSVELEPSFCAAILERCEIAGLSPVRNHQA